MATVGQVQRAEEEKLEAGNALKRDDSESPTTGSTRGQNRRTQSANDARKALVEIGVNEGGLERSGQAQERAAYSQVLANESTSNVEGSTGDARKALVE